MIWDKYFDCFEGVKVLFKVLVYGEEWFVLLVFGGLFVEDRFLYFEFVCLCNKVFMEVFYCLFWLLDKVGMVLVNWCVMEIEELGFVYEFLFEL